MEQQSTGKLQEYSHQLTRIIPLAGHQPETSSEHWNSCHICWRGAYVPAYAELVLRAVSAFMTNDKQTQPALESVYKHMYLSSSSARLGSLRRQN